MVTIIFKDAKLINRQALPAGARFPQEYFVNIILSDIVYERGQIFRRVHRGNFLFTWTIPYVIMVAK
jgi:hypothetical protein